MKYIITSKSKDAANYYLNKIINEENIFCGAVSLDRSKAYSVTLNNGNVYETVSCADNLRGRRADVVLYDDLCDIDSYIQYSNVGKEWISWNDYSNKNSYVVELL